MRIKDILKTNDIYLIDLLKYTLKNKNIYTNTQYLLTEKEKNRLLKYRKRLKNDTPIEYIIKKTHFYKSDFIVTKDVLIPRVESESIIPHLLKYKNILDLGCGCGALGISVKKENHNIQVTLSDISKRALKIAEKNIGKLDITLIQSNLLSKINTTNMDCIIANLPYIKDNTDLPKSVIKYEPKIALFGGKDGLFYIKELIKELHKKQWIGDLFLEMDTAQIKEIQIKKRIIKDSFGYKRFIKIHYPILDFNIDKAFCN